jgi:hypothetical protein
MIGTDDVAMGYMWRDDVASVHEAWDDNEILYPTLSHLISPCIHTVPHYISLSYPYLTLIKP